MIDLHVDCIIQNRLFGYRIDRKHRAGIPGQPFVWHTDIPRMREAGYDGACLGIHWLPWESERGWSALHAQIDYLDEVAERTDGVIRVREPGDWRRARREEKLALAPGVEGAHMLDGRLGRVPKLARRGVAYLTLAHFSRNSAATPAMGRAADEKTRLTPFGRDLVLTLQEHEIAVDLAHVNTPGVLDACTVAERPVLCTHTGVKGVCDNSRNISDEEIDAISETGGVVGIIFAPAFLSGGLLASSKVVADHIEYVADRAGVRHVAIGSDYDGWIPSIPSDQRDCRDASKVFEELERRGWYDAEIEAVRRGNALEVLSGER